MRPYLLKGHERPLTQIKCAAQEPLLRMLNAGLLTCSGLNMAMFAAGSTGKVTCLSAARRTCRQIFGTQMTACASVPSMDIMAQCGRATSHVSLLAVLGSVHSIG
jgi:hypothetical protein